MSIVYHTFVTKFTFDKEAGASSLLIQMMLITVTNCKGVAYVILPVAFSINPSTSTAAEPLSPRYGKAGRKN